MEKPPVLEVRHVTKRFPGVLANDDVSFSLNEGEIHVILGENGAGKTTLLNIIYGLYKPDQGEIFIDGQPIEIEGPHDAIRQGIGMVHQHFMLVEPFTVAENIILGEEITKGLSLDIQRAAVEIMKISEEYGLNVDPYAVVEDLPVGVRQRVEIVKALFRKARILILDEPTAVLTPQEANELFVIMRQLTKRGESIIFITHKLKEVMEVADRITVMRRGKVVGSTTPQQATINDLANMMVGREVILSVNKAQAEPKDIILEVRNLTVLGDQKNEVVKNVSFQLRGGEILGIAGVQGNGQTELVEVITGLREAQSGELLIKGEPVPFGNPRNLIEHGMAHIPEDRQKHGLVLPYSVADNLILCTYYKQPFAKGITRNDPAILANATIQIERFDVRTPSALVPVSNLSGGNQQKVIVAREFSRPVKVLIANQPTRGLDVGSIEYIHQQIVNMRDEGAAVLVVSAELDEIMSLADRIAVMYHGEIVSIQQADEVTREELGLLMAGSKKQPVPA